MEGAKVGPEVVSVNPLWDGRWEKWVETLGVGSVFYGTAWARVLAETYGYTPEYLGQVDEIDRCRGLVPLMAVNSFLTGRRGIALPFTDECEPVGKDCDTFRPVLEQAFAIGGSRGWKYLELRGGRQYLPSAQAARRFYVHSVDLLNDESAMFAKFKPPVRRAIRKAQKSGLTVQTSHDFEAVREFYTLQCKTRRKHGLPPQPLRFFENLHKYILANGGGIVVLARAGKTPVAANVFLHSAQQAIYKFGASDTAFQEWRGSDLVMWTGLKHYAANGFATLNLGRTSLANDGLRRFKLGWGARERMLDYFKYDLRLNAFVRSCDEAFGWYNRVFSLLPLSLSRLVGSLLYRHVA